VAAPARAFADNLDERLRLISSRLPNGVVGVSVYDYLSGRSWSYNGDRWFHAASVIKVPVMVALFGAVDQGRFALNSRLLVRNRFLSVVDGTPYRVDASRDADSEVHASLGRTMRLRDLARHMIITSSNLATNLLVDLLGVQTIRRALSDLGIQGVDVCRGVEDDRAFAQGINNRITPDGAVALLRAIVAAEAISPESSTRMLTILMEQQFSGTIAPGLPEVIRTAARVAHKTGDISTASHDAGVVFLPGRPPYLAGIFVESSGDSRERAEAGVAASAAVYDSVALAGEGMLR
jgi:beta-lactamase class A